jgi:hypothetical protein
MWSEVEVDHWHTLASGNSDLERICLLLRNSPTTTLFLSHTGEDQPYRSSSSSSSVVPSLSHTRVSISSFQAAQRNSVDSTILGLVISLRSLPHPLVRTNESHCRQSGEQSWLPLRLGACGQPERYPSLAHGSWVITS